MKTRRRCAILEPHRAWTLSECGKQTLLGDPCLVLADGGALDTLEMVDGTIVRPHRCAISEKGIRNQTLSHSLGASSPETHLRCNAADLSISVGLTEGKAYDVTVFGVSMARRCDSA